MTWYHELMSEINKEMSAVAGSGRTFVLPVTAATLYRLVDMTHMPELRCCPSVQLCLPLLNTEQKEAAVMTLTHKVAAANGRIAPFKIPATFRKLLDFAGSTPFNVATVMQGLGDRWWREGYHWQEGDHWQKGKTFFSCYHLVILHPFMIVSLQLRLLKMPAVLLYSLLLV